MSNEHHTSVIDTYCFDRLGREEVHIRCVALVGGGSKLGRKKQKHRRAFHFSSFFSHTLELRHW